MTRRKENSWEDRQREEECKIGNEKEEVKRLKYHRRRLRGGWTSNTSVGQRGFWTGMVVFHLACMSSQGLEIEPVPLVKQGTEETQHHNYCLGSGEPLRFLEPREFAEVYNHTDFREFHWYVSHEPHTLYIWTHRSGEPRVKQACDPAKYKQYQNWGLEVMDVTKEDEGVYWAEIEFTYYINISWFNVTMISPPRLSSGKLELRREVVDNQTVKLTCGDVEYVGDPPITLELKAANGTVLNTSHTEGSLSFIMPRGEDTGYFVCEIDRKNSVAATACFNETDWEAWTAEGPPFPTSTSSPSTKSSSTPEQSTTIPTKTPLPTSTFGPTTTSSDIPEPVPPVLASETLTLKRQVEGDSVTLTCGEVVSLGDPPLTLHLKTSEGQILNSSYAQGRLSVTIPKEQDKNRFYVCEIDWANPGAASGLTKEERDLWIARLGPPPVPVVTLGPPLGPVAPDIPSNERNPKTDKSVIILGVASAIAFFILVITTGCVYSIWKNKGTVTVRENTTRRRQSEIMCRDLAREALDQVAKKYEHTF